MGDISIRCTILVASCMRCLGGFVCVCVCVFVCVCVSVGGGVVFIPHTFLASQNKGFVGDYNVYYCA